MAATAARIGFIQQEFRRAVSESASMRARFGTLARQSDDPIETFFDDVDDAQIMADERQALLGKERRRFALTVNGLSDAMGITFGSTIPTARYVDTERGVNRLMLVTDVIHDFARDQATFTVWG